MAPLLSHVVLPVGLVVGLIAGCAHSGATRQTSPRQGNIVTAEEIERLAYTYWEARGGLGGSPEEDWLRAEEEVRRRRTA